MNNEELTPEESAEESSLHKMLTEEPVRLDPLQRRKLYETLEETRPARAVFTWLLPTFAFAAAACLAFVLIFNRDPLSTQPITASVQIDTYNWATSAQIDARLAATKRQLDRAIHQNNSEPSSFELRLNKIKSSIQNLKTNINQTS